MQGIHRRTWLTFKLSTLFLVVTAAAVALSFPRICRQIQFQRFKTFADKDIRTLSDSQRELFAGIVKTLLPEAQSSVFQPHENWFVWQLQTDSGHVFNNGGCGKTSPHTDWVPDSGRHSRHTT